MKPPKTVRVSLNILVHARTIESSPISGVRNTALIVGAYQIWEIEQNFNFQFFYLLQSLDL